MGYFRIFLVFQILKVLPATRTCLTQAGARASNTFRHPIWVVESRSGTPFGWLKAEWKTPVAVRKAIENAGILNIAGYLFFVVKPNGIISRPGSKLYYYKT